MNKLFMNLVDFIDGDINKYTALVVSSVYFVINAILTPIFQNTYFITILSLILVDTLFGVYIACSLKKFSLLKLLPLKKIFKYMIYVWVAMKLSSAPTAIIILPIVGVLYTYIILREGSSILVKSSKIFGDKGMQNIAEGAEDKLDNMLPTSTNNDKPEVMRIASSQPTSPAGD